MVLNNAFKSLLLAIAFGLFLLSCGNDDDDGTVGEPCTFMVNGTVKDALTGLPVDSIQVRLHTVLQLGSTGNPLFNPIVEYTKAGSFSMEIECLSEPTPFHISYNDPLNRYYFESVVNLFYKNIDDQVDIVLCREAYANFHLSNAFDSDSLDFRYAGIKCGNSTHPFDIGTYRTVSTDTTLVIQLPTSSEVSLQMRSFRSGALRWDTTFVFPTTPGDTVQLESIY